MYNEFGEWVELAVPISIRKVMICYNPRKEEVENAPALGKVMPAIALVHWPDKLGVNRAWRSSTGASYSWLHDKTTGTRERRQHFVLSTALGLIMRDGYTWQQVNGALWDVAEYRDGIVPDMRSPDGRTVAAPGCLI